MLCTKPDFVSRAEKWAQYLNEDLSIYFDDAEEQVVSAKQYTYSIYPVSLTESVFSGSSPRLVDADCNMVVEYSPERGWRAVLPGEEHVAPSSLD